ncbi:hypothetical protein [Vibrio mediterranei]|uniref:hypothetical protein n=1 Tax=Vibrio mediterranei TaxID=689 RepID=UPI001EFCA307|nr:hypothetical protein [Vibrio mediterranei]MCG9657624.1 hypothetical protein [Vibrio mediterranei]
MPKFISERTMNVLTVLVMIALTLLAVMYHEQIFSKLVLTPIIEFVSQFTIN